MGINYIINDWPKYFVAGIFPFRQLSLLRGATVSTSKINKYMYCIYIIYIVTDIYLEHQFFSKISEPFLRTSKQLHLEHQNCSKYALRTSEKQILRTSPLIFCILRTLNTHILRTCPVTLVNLHIYTQIPWWTPYLEHFLPSLLQHSIPFLREQYPKQSSLQWEGL